MATKGKVEMKKGPWTRDEDKILLAYIQQHGHGGWRTLPERAGLERCGKSCRMRWTNYLRPDIKRGKFSNHEEKSIIRLHALLGNKWSAIAAYLPNRTDNEIKNYWNTRLKKRLTRMGIDPTTHKPKNSPPGSATVRHMAQWEAARLEAEARLARQSKRASNHSAATARPSPPSLPLPCLDVLKVWQANNLESPTSTLNFPCSSNITVPTISENENTVVSRGEVEWYTEMKGEMGNSMNNHDVIYPVGNYCFGTMIGAMDQASYNHDFMGDNLVGVGVYEDCKVNYWEELLDLVNSSPTLM